MKKFILSVLTILSFCSSQSNAQFLKAYGIKFAVTSSNQIRDYTSFTTDSKRRTGIDVGLYAEWLNNPFLSIVTQLEYCQRGSGENYTYTNESTPDIGTTVTLYDRLDYLSVPVLAKFSMLSEPIRPYALLGPRLDFLVGEQTNQPGLKALYHNFREPVVGGTVGLGGEFNSGLPVVLSVEGRYNFDLTTSYSNQVLTVRNNAFDIWIGVSI
jgi:Outer membrane protein beta-barrel domain